MLVLSRQRDETIMIGDDIEVTVVDIRGDKVRLGINAPREISVHRKEVYDAIRRENRAAAQVKPEDLSVLGKITPKLPTDPEHEKDIISQILLVNRGDLETSATQLRMTVPQLKEAMARLKIEVKH